METQNESDSGNEPDHESRQENNERLWKIINSYSGNEAKVQLFIARLALDEKRMIKESEKNENESKEPYFGYRLDAGYIDKITFVFRGSTKLMTTQELKEELLKCEPILAQKWANPLKSVSEIVYGAVKLECLIRYKKVGLYGFTYGLPEWFDDNNKLIGKFRR